ncbi:HET domain containing protein [Hyaloscypha variabilis]
MPEFKYSPFDCPNCQIRVVDLHPPSGALVPHQQVQQQDLRCSVRTINLDDDLKYTALSYTWGSPDRPARLIVDTGGVNQGESAIKITKSLETALLQLRESTKITLWIDQLCINQDDVDEKSKQVPLMKIIYKKAIDVLVWLGPATHESDHLLQILDEIGKQATKAERLYGGNSTLALTQTYNVTLFKLRKRHSLGRKFIIPAENLRAFVNLDWWTRVWVVQEISVATSVTFACGAQRITYERLRNALRFYSFHIWRKSTWVQSRHWLVNLIAIRAVLALQKAPYDSPASQMLASSYRFKVSTNGHDLLGILELSHVVRDPNLGYKLQATNNRDKIYGLLGLAKDDLGIKTNYDKSVSEVYVDAARALLKHGHVDILWYCQFPKSEENSSELPSWTPDLSNDGYIQMPYGSGFSPTSRPFAASGEKKAAVQLVEYEELHIKLKGVFVDEVVVIGQLWGQTPGLKNNQTELKHSDIFSSKGLQLKTATSFLEELNLLFDQARDLPLGLDPETIEEARWRTPIGDKEMEDNAGGTRRATSQSRETYIEIRRRIQIEKNRPVPTQKAPQKRRFTLLRVLGFLLWTFVRFLFRRLLKLLLRKKEESRRNDSFAFPDGRGGNSYMNSMRQMCGRRPFRTKYGYVGLGPAGMTEEDIVCIFYGAQVPYVLRPDGNNQFQLVGEAYIHGIMDGEYLKTGREETEFTLY